MTLRRPQWHKHPGVRSGDKLSFGERAADVLKRYFGTWSALFAVAIWIVAWMLLQKTSFAWDKAPYILLNLCLSCLAAVQGIILQISANRGDRISSEVALHTEQNTGDIKTLLAENTALTQAVKANTDVLDEIHRHVSALAPQAGHFPPGEQR
jgi:uncharacterized membrane protein